MLRTLAISNYRSLHSLIMPLGQLNVVTGPNGSGKSNVYRALRLLAETARGGVVGSLAREGGFESTMWAGPETISAGMKRGRILVQGGPRKEPVALRMGFSGDEYSYVIDLGLPPPEDPPASPPSAFLLDPEIKQECIWNGPVIRPSSLLVDRQGSIVRYREEGSGWTTVASRLNAFESMLSQIADPLQAPEVLIVREKIRSWRFYDYFRTDGDAPARQTQIGTRTPVLADDGRDLAAAMQTIIEIGDKEALDVAIEEAFPGAKLKIQISGTRFHLTLLQHGLLRPLTAAELSDGTLRYLLLIAALLTPRPPPIMVLNEPENSLHPDLLHSLARLIGEAAKSSQVWVISHASRLIAALEQLPECHSIELEKELSETRIKGVSDLGLQSWHWPSR